MYSAAPWGDRRADLRQGLSTANLMLAQSSQEGRTEEAFRQILSALIDYLPGSNTEETADLQALALMKAEQNG